MFARWLSALAVILIALRPAVAEPQDGLARLSAALHLPEVLGVMRQEALDYGQSLEQTLFPGQGGQAWSAEVAKIYEPAALQADLLRRLQQMLPADRIPAMLAFFETPLGQRIVVGEIAARGALRDPAEQERARALLATMIETKDPKLAQIVEFARANDLVESNVAAAMNSDVAFYRGLIAGHAKGFTMDGSRILAEVSSQQGVIRQDTENWLFPFLALAYERLSEADLAAYLAFSRGGPGQALNAALFGAIDDIFLDRSLTLGKAAARYLGGSAL